MITVITRLLIYINQITTTSKCRWMSFTTFTGNRQSTNMNVIVVIKHSRDTHIPASISSDITVSSYPLTPVCYTCGLSGWFIKGLTQCFQEGLSAEYHPFRSVVFLWFIFSCDQNFLALEELHWSIFVSVTFKTSDISVCRPRIIGNYHAWLVVQSQATIICHWNVSHSCYFGLPGMLSRHSFCYNITYYAYNLYNNLEWPKTILKIPRALSTFIF